MDFFAAMSYIKFICSLQVIFYILKAADNDRSISLHILEIHFFRIDQHHLTNIHESTEIGCKSYSAKT